VDGVSGLENPPRDGEGDRAAKQRGGGGSHGLRRPETYAARKLRREMTLPEVLLWNRLRRSQLGVKFRTQHAIPPYVVDFYCPSAKLVIEVDGLAHDNEERSAGDAARDRELVSKGYAVMRFPASMILDDMDGAIAAILARLDSPLHRACGTVPLPASGEDFQ
jgi:very-short-patch-repair endonuclease